jgi:hypothetical protein
MKKLIVSTFLVTALALTATSQTATEKITGNWTASKSAGGSVVETKNWHFAADGNGTVEIKNKGLKLRCTTYVPFTWAITGDSIRIVSGKADAECEIIGGDDSNSSYAIEKVNKYSNKTDTYFLKFEDSKNLVMGESKLKKD